jgi:Ca2+/Na+ antiporter
MNFFKDKTNIIFSLIGLIFLISVSTYLITGKDLATEIIGINPVILTVVLFAIGTASYFSFKIKK